MYPNSYVLTQGVVTVIFTFHLCIHTGQGRGSSGHWQLWIYLGSWGGVCTLSTTLPCPWFKQNRAA